MRLTRVYTDAPLVPGEKVAIEGSAANHITRVLRLRVADTVTLFNGTNQEYDASIEAFHKDAVVVAIREERSGDRESPLQLILAQGISRGERMDWILQKATELGASRIVPVFTERSVVRLDAKQAERKLQHWRGITISACEQCGRNRLPELDSPLAVHEFLSRLATGQTRLLLSPTADLTIDDLAATAATTATAATPAPHAASALGAIVVLIGPEGGLTDLEEELALRAGFRPVRMGPRILRTETAAIAALTIIQQRFGDL
ncbi:MAG TPA: 16S rRNA (uracil(1498)-N(3))-methyltransferase [Steroidobacteraceae bacterium]|jgi:16S rRNA (uracil1498-N3)-methyltransferase